VEKTTLMPIGGLEVGIPQEITDLGFAIVTEIKCLGLRINNRAENLTLHFDEKIQKIRQLIGSWSRYNLSLPGRISIAKTMLLSQIGYIGCFLTPTDEQLLEMQTVIDGFVKKNLVIAAERLYLKPSEGGLGLICLSSYISALQCSWLKRCLTSINDPWRWNLARSCNFNLDMVRMGDVNEFLHPAANCIIKSVCNLQKKFWKKHENFLMAPITDNDFFFRAKPERRARNAGILDRNFFGAAFYDQNKEALRALRLNNFLQNGVLIEYNMLVRTTGIDFTAAHYLNLQTACHFAVQKYSGKNGSNGSTLPLTWLFQRVKKGSRLFRLTIEWNPDQGNMLGELRVVKTFFELAQNPVPENCFLKTLYGSWNWHFLGNKIRAFCFQFYNNSLSIGARLAARYEQSGIIIDSRCTFCVKSMSWVPNRETFLHLFYECQYITNIVKSFSTIMLREEMDERKARLGCLTGLYENVSVRESIFYVLTSIFLNYTLWQFRQKKTVPGLATLCHEVDYHFQAVASCSKKISDLASASDSPVCRRWREHGHGRG
jgi:hypothetical protein